MLPVLLRCVRNQLAPIPMQEAARPQRGAQAQPGGPSTERRAEALTLVANLLSEAGVKGFKLDASDDTVDVSWSAPGIRGGLAILTDGRIEQPTDTTPHLVAAAARKCKGKFISGAMPEEDGGARAFSSCQVGTAAPTVSQYLTLRRPAGGYYIFVTHAVAAGNDNAEPGAEKQIRAAAYRVVK